MENNLQISSIESLVPVDYSNSDRPTISGRELYKFLGVGGNYTTWFKRMCDYGFIEHKDYESCFPNLESENQHGGQNKIDHQITVSMAKELCMVQRNERGKIAREYFISIEEKWNSPEQVMARGLIAANNKINSLLLTVESQTKQIEIMTPKASYYDAVLNSKGLVSITEIAKDYGMGGKTLNKILHDKKVQYKVNDTWVLYSEYAKKGYTGTKTAMFGSSEGVTYTKESTYWTQKGRLFIYELLKKDGKLPIIEAENQ